MKNRSLWLLAGSLAFLVVACSPSAEGTKTEASSGQSTGSVAFADVQAVLSKNCYACHSGGKGKDGVNLDTQEWIQHLVKPGDPAGSEIIKVMRHADGEPQMPPNGPIPDTEIAKVETWIKDGAKV